MKKNPLKSFKVYEYSKCSTCRNAIRFLDQHHVDYEKHSIIDTPPSRDELRRMLKYLDGNLKKLFNTSGIQYRELKLTEKLPKMTEAQALELLEKNGMLIRRPFLLSKERGAVGFNEDAWMDIINSGT